MLLTRKIEFSASHTCWNPALSEAENQAAYGADANRHGHGHNYSLEVTLEGEPDAVTGMVVDLKAVKAILEREVMEPMDHRHLNLEVPPFDRVVPTTENLAVEIWRRLEGQFGAGPAKLRAVRLYETEDLFVEYEGR
ncbi:MAG: 6-carboxytetrahydropterin synthase [Acidobacteria bacterium]|nr:6-carboxytetrahydropterin synthase [Acidobacteriota bacterium]